MITLKLIDESANEINLNSGDIVLLDGYFPETALDLEQRIGESFDVMVKGALAVDKIRSINRFFEYARNNTIGPNGVWVYFSIDGGTAWRSRIYNGMISYNNRLYSQFRRGVIRATIFIERDPFWEGPEQQIPLTNGNGTNNTSGLNVYNANDGAGSAPNKRNNYIEIADNAISGDLPAPVRLEMTNQFNSYARLSELWISHNVYSTPATFQHVIEGEAGIALQGGITNQAASGYSGGYVKDFVWSNSYQTPLVRFNLNTAYLNAANKRWFKILCVFTSSVQQDIRLQTKIMFPAGAILTTVASSQEVLLSGARIQEIGEIQIPPWLLSSGDLAPVDLVIYGQKSGTANMQIDFLQISPLDGYRVLIPRGYGAAYGVRIVDDGINQQLYTDGWSEGGKTGHYTSIGKPLQIVPGKLQRIYFLQQGNTGDADIMRVLSVKAYYRPRRCGL